MAHHSSQEAIATYFTLDPLLHTDLESWGGIHGEVGSKEGSQPKSIVSESGCLLLRRISVSQTESRQA
jgi:hypothetical protein